MKHTRRVLVAIILLGTAMLVGHATAQDCVEPPAGMISWWPGDGNAQDSANGNNGILMGDTTFVPGKVGQAFSFDGDGDYVELGDVLNNITVPFTLEGWMNTPGTGADLARGIFA